MDSTGDFKESRKALKGVADSVERTYFTTKDLKAAMVCIRAHSEIRKTYDTQAKIKAMTGKPSEL